MENNNGNEKSVDIMNPEELEAAAGGARVKTGGDHAASSLFGLDPEMQEKWKRTAANAKRSGVTLDEFISGERAASGEVRNFIRNLWNTL